MILNILTVEVFCANSCFVVLFLTTFYYWSKIIFSSELSYTKTGLIGYLSAIFLITVQLIIRWIDSGHFPLSNLYESLLFLIWCLLILYIYIENSIKRNFLGVLTSPTILCLISFTDFILPPELQQSHPLVPALQSNWLIMHVTVMIASYAALLLGCLMSIAYLIFSHSFGSGNNLSQQDLILDNKVSLINSNSTTNSILVEPNLNSKNTFLNVLQFSPLKTKDQTPLIILNFLDNLSYRTIGIGFCFLTLGILSGAVWANETWGNYWSWDPKETWALITWLTFASYLHIRLIGGWTGYKPACIASLGFFIIWICYLGVNILGQGLHSYGFLQI
jgi:cytochrome c-type biogenesis protein CcsB